VHNDVVVSEWITRVLVLRQDWKISQMSPKSTMAPCGLGVMSVVKIFTVGKPA